MLRATTAAPSYFDASYWRARPALAFAILAAVITALRILALIFGGWKFAFQSWGYKEVSVMSPANVPIFQFKMVIPLAGVLMFIQGVAQVCRCLLCIREGNWPERDADVEETETMLMHQAEDDAQLKTEWGLDKGSRA